MIDDVWKREEIDSPCIKLCVLHSEAKICVGCHRSSEEIQMWSKYTPEQRIMFKTGIILKNNPIKESVSYTIHFLTGFINQFQNVK